eukprot:s2168_g4.t5
MTPFLDNPNHGINLPQHCTACVGVEPPLECGLALIRGAKDAEQRLMVLIREWATDETAHQVEPRALQSSSSSSATPVAPSSIEMEKELSRRLDLCQEELVRERSRSEELAAELHEARQSKDSEVEQLRQQLAIRERELVAAASARHRCSARSEALAASLRSKLTELEAWRSPRRVARGKLGKPWEQSRFS